jgi:hypothetical protein
MRIVILILFGALLFSSCGKKRSIHITATNAATGERYAGLQYFIVSSTTSADGEKYKTEKTGFLNKNGEASEIIREKQFRTYSVRVVEPENSCYNKVITMYFGSPNDEDGHFNFEFAGCTYLTLSVNNINCQGASDKIVFDLQPTYIPGYNNIIPTEKYGCYSNTFIESQVPFGQWEATWEVTRNGITTYHDSIFTIDENEHYNFVINY